MDVTGNFKDDKRMHYVQECVLRAFYGCFKKASRFFSVSKKFQRNQKRFPGFQESFMGVSWIFPECSNRNFL